MLHRWAAETLFQTDPSGLVFLRGDIVSARVLGLTGHEVPITWVYGAGSRVNVLRDSLRMTRDLLYIRRQARRGVYHADQV